MKFQSTKLYILIKGKTETLYRWQSACVSVRVAESCKLAHMVIYFTNIKPSAYQSYCSSYYYLTGYKEARMEKQRIGFFLCFLSENTKTVTEQLQRFSE